MFSLEDDVGDDDDYDDEANIEIRLPNSYWL